MATLTIPDKHVTLQDTDEIREYLAARGIWIAQWEASHPFSDTASPDEILEAYAHVLQPFMAENGYQTADVISVHAQMPNLPELRAKFLREHTHTEDEVRFFVDGQGYFWFNLDPLTPDPHEPVFCVKCSAGDILSVPANVKHWFDLGAGGFCQNHPSIYGRLGLDAPLHRIRHGRPIPGSLSRLK